jgi:hypothetical protein
MRFVARPGAEFAQALAELIDPHGYGGSRARATPALLASAFGLGLGLGAQVSEPKRSVIAEDMIPIADHASD